MKKIKIQENIKDYKNKYKGERCFVLGNGPSLNKIDLNLLKDEYSFAINKINLIYKKYEWRPSVYCMFSIRKSKEWINNISESIKLDIPIFINDVHKNIYKRNQKIHWLKCKGSEKFKEKGIFDDIEKGVHKYASTLLAMIEIVNYMGFDEIYLIGCDLGYKKDGISHFDKDYFKKTTKLNYNTHNVEMAKMHKSILNYFNKQGKVIKNATIGGELESYERVDFYNLLKK